MPEETDKRYVKFDYFEVSVSKTKNRKAKTADTKPFDLTLWMNKIRPKFDADPKSVTYNFYGEQIRCDLSEMIGIDTNTPLARMHFTKLREKNSPAIGTISNVKLEAVKLGPEEFIAEDVTALFDPSDSILMLQKNIYSLSRGVLEAYVNLVWNEDKEKGSEEYIHLIPVFQKNNFEKGKKGGVYSTISFQTANSVSGASWSNPFRGQIGQIFDSMKAQKGLNIEVKISASRRKDDSLDRDAVIGLIDEIKAQYTLFGKAEVAFKNGEDSDNRTTYVDLMNGKVQSVLPFDVPKKKPLRAENVWTAMVAEYRPDGKNMAKIVRNNMDAYALPDD